MREIPNIEEYYTGNVHTMKSTSDYVKAIEQWAKDAEQEINILSNGLVRANDNIDTASAIIDNKEQEIKELFSFEESYLNWKQEQSLKTKK